MSWYGARVSGDGIQRNVLVTSCSGLSELLTISYTGTSANTVSRVSTMRRVQMKDGGGAISPRFLDMVSLPPPGRADQVHGGHQEQEDQHEHRHRRALAEVPVDERGLVDV